MSPKHKLITAVWCAVTMVATLVLSHGHLIVREILSHWPVSDTWEGRLESALYTQGGLVLIAGLVIGGVILVRSHFGRELEQRNARKEHAQVERHERATASRHEAMMNMMAGLPSPPAVESGPEENSFAKKPRASGAGRG